jgi:hypothetical protein
VNERDGKKLWLGLAGPGVWRMQKKDLSLLLFYRQSREEEIGHNQKSYLCSKMETPRPDTIAYFLAMEDFVS